MTFLIYCHAFLLNCRFSEGRAMLHSFLYSIITMQVLIIVKGKVEIQKRGERKEKAGKERQGRNGRAKEGRGNLVQVNRVRQ